MAWKLPPDSNFGQLWDSPHYFTYVRDQNPMLPLNQCLKTFSSGIVSGFIAV